MLALLCRHICQRVKNNHRGERHWHTVGMVDKFLAISAPARREGSTCKRVTDRSQGTPEPTPNGATGSLGRVVEGELGVIFNCDKSSSGFL
jgi:hypothetical protein